MKALRAYVIVSACAAAAVLGWAHRSRADMVDADGITLTVTVCNGSDCGSQQTGNAGGSASVGGSSPAPAGGGAPSSLAIPTSVTFSGMAYPYATVTLMKDGARVASQPAGPDARFTISISGLAGGAYTFGVSATDTQGRKSLAYSFTVNVTAGVGTLISGIFLPPTIGVDKSTVKRGETVTIFGQSVPKSEVGLTVHSGTEIKRSVTANQSGSWSYVLNSLELEYGEHSAQAFARAGDDASSLSPMLNFTVGMKTVLASLPKPEPPAAAKAADLSGDSRVNIVDFSILSFWFKRPLATDESKKADLNRDGKVDLVDFSIMAYNWSG